MPTLNASKMCLSVGKVSETEGRADTSSGDLLKRMKREKKTSIEHYLKLLYKVSPHNDRCLFNHILDNLQR